MIKKLSGSQLFNFPPMWNHPMRAFVQPVQRVVFSGLLVSLLTLASAPAQATGMPVLTPGEMAMLPAYCPDTQGFGYGDATFNTSPRAGHWVGLMGKSFWTMHHHCLGIYKAKLATRPGLQAQVRKGLLEGAVDEFTYVIDWSTPHFIMLPEVFRMRGDAQLKLRRLADASESYAAARRLKPDYAPAYTNWADELVRTGLKKSALTLLEDGLRVARDSKELRASYTQLGGNVEAFVKALPPAPPRAEAASAPASAPASGPALAANAERPASSPP